jgi:hypothetical protein
MMNELFFFDLEMLIPGRTSLSRSRSCDLTDTFGMCYERRISVLASEMHMLSDRQKHMRRI